MRHLSKFALLFALTSGPLSWGISRVGNIGLDDTVQGFSVAQVPAPFQQIDGLFNSGGVALTSLEEHSFGIGSSFVSRAFVYPMSENYPELVALNRAEWVQHLTSIGAWTAVTAPDPCMQAMTIVNGTTRVTLVAWGNGHGLQLISPTTLEDEFAQDFVNAIQLNAGACGW